jgi:hypothetical protein
MRDNHEGMPEIIDAYEKEGLYFGVVEITLGKICKQFQFGVSRDGYRALRRILQLRQFNAMPGLKDRHFFALSYGEISGSSDYKVGIRIEQGRDGRKLKHACQRICLQTWCGSRGLKISPRQHTCRL